MDMEEKTFPFEIKEVTEEGIVKGYAAIFGKADAMGEIVESGAFTKTLKEGKPYPMLWYHDPRNPIGIAQLAIDGKGLKVNGELNLEVQAAREKHSLMKQKAIRGLSFGFKTIKDIWEGTTRRLKEVKLYEVSPVTFGAHHQALISSVKQLPDDEKAKVLERALEKLKEYKSDEIYHKHIDDAITALEKLLTVKEPPPGTPDQVKGLYAPILEVLGLPQKKDKPPVHLFGETIKTLENQTKEK